MISYAKVFLNSIRIFKSNGFNAKKEINKTNLTFKTYFYFSTETDWVVKFFICLKTMFKR